MRRRFTIYDSNEERDVGQLLFTFVERNFSALIQASFLFACYWYRERIAIEKQKHNASKYSSALPCTANSQAKVCNKRPLMLVVFSTRGIMPTLLHKQHFSIPSSIFQP